MYFFFRILIKHQGGSAPEIAQAALIGGVPAGTTPRILTKQHSSSTDTISGPAVVSASLSQPAVSPSTVAVPKVPIRQSSEEKVIIPARFN